MTPIFLHIIGWLERHQLPCPIKDLLHVNCPGCGLQRSFIELLKGNVALSFAYHPATIPLLLFFLFAFSNFYFKFKKGIPVIVGSYIIVVLIVVTNYIYKILY